MSDEVKENSVQETEEVKAVINIRGQEYSFSYSVEVADKFTKKYHITADEQLISAAEREGYYATKGKYAVPGFRKGKATMHQIKSYYGENVFFNDALDYLIDNLYRSLYQDVLSKENYAANPDIQLGSITRSKFEYAYIITVFAEVEELNYTGLEIHCYDEEKYVNELADKKLVDAREKVGSWENIEGRAVENGDTANIDYLGKVDGVAFEGGKAEAYDLVIGSHTFVPGFEDGVIGMNVGETKDIDVTFPTDYHADLAGKAAVFTVKLNAIKVKTLPELDDDFAKDVSDYDTLDELKASYKEEAAKEGHIQVENLNNESIVNAVIAANNYELPAKMLEEAAQAQIKSFGDRLKSAGLTFEQYAMYSGMTKEQMVDDFKQREESLQKKNILLSAIVEKEGITVEESEIEAKVAENAIKANKELEVYKSEMKKDEVDYIFNTIYTTKLIARLKELNTLVYDK